MLEMKNVQHRCSTRFAAMLRDELHVFVACITESLLKKCKNNVYLVQLKICREFNVNITKYLNQQNRLYHKYRFNTKASMVTTVRNMSRKTVGNLAMILAMKQNRHVGIVHHFVLSV